MVRSVLVLALALGVTAPAVASYELGLVLQNDRVYRFDAMSAAAFGSFPVTHGANGLVAYRSTGQAYVLNGGYVETYNYSTGIAGGRFSIPSGGMSLCEGMDDGEVLIGYADRVERRRVSDGRQLGTSLFWTGGGFSYEQGAIAMRSKGIYYLLAEKTSYHSDHDWIMGVDASNVLRGSMQNAGPFLTTTSTIYGGDSSGLDLVFLSQRTDTSMQATPTNASVPLAGYGPVMGYNSTLWLSAQLPRVQFGHGGQVSLLTVSESFWELRRAYPEALASAESLRILFLDATDTIDGYALVSAPEPGSLAGLGLGALVLMRRRRMR